MKATKPIEYFKNSDRAKKINFIFLALMAAFIIISVFQVISSAVTSGRFFNLGVFQRIENVEFSDFFHTNDMIADNSPYLSDTSSYPPFVFMIARIFALFGDYSEGYGDMLLQPSAVFSLVLFYIMCYAGIALLTIYIMRSHGFGKGVSAAACAVIIYNMPMLFNFERGNYIICALVFSLAFYAFYDSEYKGMREFSYIMLAFAAGIKLYPALFAVLLLRERRICDFLRCAAYSLLVILISFLTIDGGFSNIPQFFHWLSDFSKDLTDYGYNYSLASTVGVVAALFGADVWDLSGTIVSVQTYLPYIMLVLCAIASLLVRKKWQAMALVSVVIIQFPKISFTYALMFMALPILEFMLEKDKRRRDYLYMALMLISVMPVYFGMALPTIGIIVNQIIISAALIIFEIMLIAEGIIRAVTGVRSYRIKNSAKVLNQDKSV